MRVLDGAGGEPQQAVVGADSSREGPARTGHGTDGVGNLTVEITLNVDPRHCEQSHTAFYAYGAKHRGVVGGGSAGAVDLWPPAGVDEPILRVGDLCIDIPHHTVEAAGCPIDLTPKEFSLLVLVARHAGKVLTHRMMLQQVWGPEYGTESEYLRVYASQLRKKLGEDPARPRLVTEPGVGDRLIDRDADMV